MKESFILTFSFENGFQCIDDALQEIRAMIFRTPKEPMTWVQPHQNAHLQQILECYNLTIEEGDEVIRNINILESEGHRKMERLDVKIPYVT